jgi:hypothetical protein
MFPLLFLASLAALPAPTTAEVDDAAAEQCRLAFEQRLGLKIGSIAVTASNHANGWTVIRGSFSGYHPPAPAAPGMAAPLHVIDMRYGYRCWLRGASVRRTAAHKIAE